MDMQTNILSPKLLLIILWGECKVSQTVQPHGPHLPLIFLICCRHWGSHCICLYLQNAWFAECYLRFLAHIKDQCQTTGKWEQKHIDFVRDKHPSHSHLQVCTSGVKMQIQNLEPTSEHTANSIMRKTDYYCGDFSELQTMWTSNKTSHVSSQLVSLLAKCSFQGLWMKLCWLRRTHCYTLCFLISISFQDRTWVWCLIPWYEVVWVSEVLYPLRPKHCAGKLTGIHWFCTEFGLWTETETRGQREGRTEGIKMFWRTLCWLKSTSFALL